MRQDLNEENLEMNNEDEFDGESNVNGNDQHNFPIDEEDLDEVELELSGAEFSALNSAMDQLQAALDTLESRNAGIHEELLQLLQSNREIRLGLNAQEADDDDTETEQETTADELNLKNTETSSGAESSTHEIRADSSTAAKIDSTSCKLDSPEDSITSQLARVNVSKSEACAPE